MPSRRPPKILNPRGHVSKEEEAKETNQRENEAREAAKTARTRIQRKLADLRERYDEEIIIRTNLKRYEYFSSLLSSSPILLSSSPPPLLSSSPPLLLLLNYPLLPLPSRFLLQLKAFFLAPIAHSFLYCVRPPFMRETSPCATCSSTHW